MLTGCSVLLIKKNNFNLPKGMTVFNLAEMMQVVNLDFQSESDPLNVSFQYVNKLMMPLLGLYKTEFEKKATSDKTTFGNILRKVGELNFSIAQCQEMVTVPEVKLDINPHVREIVAKKEVDKFLSDLDQLSADEVGRMGEDVVKWNRDIDGLLKHQFDLINSTTLQEQIYWNTFVAALRDV